MVPMIAGVILSGVVFGAARVSGFIRERLFAPILLIFIAVFYIVFAVQDRRTDIVIYETLVFIVFFMVAYKSFYGSLYLAVVGLVLHGMYDFMHNYFFINRGIPVWFPQFCMTFDILFAVFLLLYFKNQKKSDVFFW